MPWQSLGTIQITDFDWHLFPDTLDSSVGLFRVSQSWSGTLPKGVIWLAAQFSGSEYALFDAIQPYNNSTRLISQSIPQLYLQSGLSNRKIGLKADRKTIWYDDTNWSFTVEYFQPETTDQYPANLVDLSQVESALDTVDAALQTLTETYDL